MALPAFDRFVGYHVPGALVVGQFEHHVEHHFFDDRSQPTSAGIFFQGTVRNGLAGPAR